MGIRPIPIPGMGTRPSLAQWQFSFFCHGNDKPSNNYYFNTYGASGHANRAFNNTDRHTFSLLCENDDYYWINFFLLSHISCSRPARRPEFCRKMWHYSDQVKISDRARAQTMNCNTVLETRWMRTIWWRHKVRSAKGMLDEFYVRVDSQLPQHHPCYFSKI